MNLKDADELAARAFAALTPAERAVLKARFGKDHVDGPVGSCPSCHNPPTNVVYPHKFDHKNSKGEDCPGMLHRTFIRKATVLGHEVDVVDISCSVCGDDFARGEAGK